MVCHLGSSVLPLCSHHSLARCNLTEEGAAQLLGVDGSPTTETEQLTEEAAKSSRMGALVTFADMVDRY